VSSGTQIEYVDATGAASWATMQDTGLNPGVSATFSAAGGDRQDISHMVAAMAAYQAETPGICSPLAGYAASDLMLQHPIVSADNH
ncbi:hypothetical protein BZM27_35820, partial [Paraburkholderia steynii]